MIRNSQHSSTYFLISQSNGTHLWGCSGLQRIRRQQQSRISAFKEKNQWSETPKKHHHWAQHVKESVHQNRTKNHLVSGSWPCRWIFFVQVLDIHLKSSTSTLWTEYKSESVFSNTHFATAIIRGSKCLFSMMLNICNILRLIKESKVFCPWQKPQYKQQKEFSCWSWISLFLSPLKSL